MPPRRDSGKVGSGCLCAAASALRGSCPTELGRCLPQAHRCHGWRRTQNDWRWLRAGGAPRWTKPRRVGMLGPYRAHLDRRWNEGCHNAAQLWREIVGLGFSGRPGTVRQWAGRRRKNEPQAPTVSGPHVVTGQPPSTRRIARLLMTEDGNALPEAEQNFVSRLLGQVPSLAACVAVQRLSKLLRRKSKESLDDVLHDAAGTALKDFVVNLRPDLPACKPRSIFHGNYQPRRGTDKQAQDVETDDVRPCRVPLTPGSRPTRGIAQSQHGICGRTQNSWTQPEAARHSAHPEGCSFRRGRTRHDPTVVAQERDRGCHRSPQQRRPRDAAATQRCPPAHPHVPPGQRVPAQAAGA